MKQLYATTENHLRRVWRWRGVQKLRHHVRLSLSSYRRSHREQNVQTLWGDYRVRLHHPLTSLHCFSFCTRDALKMVAESNLFERLTLVTITYGILERQRLEYDLLLFRPAEN